MKKRFWLSTLTAWLLFIGIDFFFHASLFKDLWQQEILAIKPLAELFLLIPLGYLSFLLLTLLIGYLLTRIYKEKPPSREAVKFALIFGALYSLSSFLGSFSYLNIPLATLALFNLVPFIEIFAVIFVYTNLLYARKNKFRKKILIWLLAFLSLIILGIIIQNIF